MTDCEFKLTVLFEQDDVPNEKINEISYIINEACTKIENLKAFVYYKVKVNGSPVVIENN